MSMLAPQMVANGTHVGSQLAPHVVPPLFVPPLVVPHPRAPLPCLPADVAVNDLDDLLDAVKARLRQCVGERLASNAELRALDEAGRVQANVLECVLALDHLHTTLSHELDRRVQLDMQLWAVHKALAQARMELAGTQAGERHARHLATHDGLTALPNRSHFHEQLAQALAQTAARRQAVAVLYLDLDGFKAVNDAHGHAAGDELLRIVAARLARSVRTEDTVSRLGGDEFACLVAGMPSRDHLGQLACKLFVAVSAAFQIGKLKLSVRPSIGIAMCPEDGATADLLLNNADAAMYRAKRQQTGYAFFNQRIAA